MSWDKGVVALGPSYPLLESAGAKLDQGCHPIIQLRQDGAEHSMQRGWWESRTTSGKE